MKTMKLLTVLLLLSLLGIQQVSATGYSHNMFVAQKMLKAKKEVRKRAPKAQEAVVVHTRTTMVKAAPAPSHQKEAARPENSAVAFTQHLGRWIVGLVCEDNCDTEKAEGGEDSEEGLSLNGRFVALLEQVVYSLVPSAQSRWQ